MKPGWLSVEQTCLSNAMGFRACFLTEDIGMLQELNKRRGTPSGVITHPVF